MNSGKMQRDNNKHMHTALFMQACVFPGAGYFLIGRKLKGFLVVFATLYFLIMPLVRFTHTMFKLIMPLSKSGNVGANVMNALPIAWSVHGGLIIWSLVGIVVLWTFGIIDVWYQLKRQTSA